MSKNGVLQSLQPLCTYVQSGNLRAEPGDLIEIDRVLHSDWALYMGDGEVASVSGPNDGLSRLSAEVNVLPLRDLADDSLVRVNNKGVPARTRGLLPLPVEEILENATRHLGDTVEYNYISKNCEHYVTEWRFGKGWSDQANVHMLNSPGVDHKSMLSAFQSLLQGSPQPGSSPKGYYSPKIARRTSANKSPSKIMNNNMSI